MLVKHSLYFTAQNSASACMLVGVSSCRLDLKALWTTKARKKIGATSTVRTWKKDQTDCLHAQVRIIKRV